MTEDTLRAEALMVSPTLLKTISGEFKGLWADYLLLKAAAFLGGYRESTTEDWETLYLLFKQSLTLDPWFFTTCYYVQGILAFRKNMGEKSIDLLKISAEHRDWDWQPNFYIGFDYFYFLKDNTKASEYLGEAAKMPGAPPIVATLGARLAQDMGKTEAAISILHFMYDRTDEKWLRQKLNLPQ